MELAGEPRALRGRHRSEEHEKLKRVVEATDGAEERANQNTNIEDPHGPQSEETIENEEHNLETEVRGEAACIEVAAPVKRRVGRPRLASTTPSRQLFMVEKPKKGATSVDNLISIIRELQAQIGDLKTEIQEQKADITGLRAEIKTLSTETATNISELKAEVTQLYTAANIGTQTNSSGSAWVNPAPWSNPATNSQEWPSLPATQHSGQNQRLSPQASQADVQEMANREKTVVITLGRTAEEIKGKPIDTLKETAQKELQREDSTKNVQVIGVSAVTKGRLEIRVASKEQAQQARSNARWVRGFGEAARAKAATWYPIKVDGVAREAICKTEGNGWQFREDALQIINESNSREGMKVQAMKLHWLSKTSDKPSGSLAVYLDSWAVAQQMVAEGIFIIGPNAATPTRFIQQEVPLRCYNCNQYGHTQLKCQANPKCGKCASQHRTSNCSGTHPDKCAACHGAHRVTDPRCSIFIKERIRMNEQQRKRGLSRPQW